MSRREESIINNIKKRKFTVFASLPVSWLFSVDYTSTYMFREEIVITN